MKNKQRGSLTVEAALVLTIFLIGYAMIISAANMIRAQMIIQHGISQAAKEISAYCYLLSKTGIMDASGNTHQEAETFKENTDKVIDTTVKLYDAFGTGVDHISSAVSEIPTMNGIEDLDQVVQGVTDVADITQQEYNEIVTKTNNMIAEGKNYFSNPSGILKGLGAVMKDEGVSAIKSFVIAAPLSNALTAKQIELYGTDAKGKDILERLGVVNGMEGLNFLGSTLFNDGETITVQVSYTMKIAYPGFDLKEFHFVQSASTRAWGAGNGDRPWRESE